MYVCIICMMCMTKKGDDLYVIPDLVSVFPFPSNIISTIFTKDYPASRVSHSFPAFSLSNQFDIKSLGNRPAVVFFFFFLYVAARSLSKMRTMPKIKRRAEPLRTSSPQRIIYLSTKIKARLRNTCVPVWDISKIQYRFRPTFQS